MHLLHLVLFLHEELELHEDLSSRLYVLLWTINAASGVDLPTEYELIRKLQQLYEAHLDLSHLLIGIERTVRILDLLQLMGDLITHLAQSSLDSFFRGLLPLLLTTTILLARLDYQ